MTTRNEDASNYSPLYFLAALGNGGLVVTFFMWLLFWVPHKGRSVPIFEDISATLSGGDQMKQAMVLAAMAGIAYFASAMVASLVWNVGQYRRFARTPKAAMLRNSNGEVQLLAMPLAFAMSINVGFICGLVFVPGLWSVIEFLFPFALLSFLLIGVWALSLVGNFWGRILTVGGFDCTRNNSFAQLLPAFALAMVGVGLAAPAALSSTAWVAGISFFASTLFIAMAVVIGTIKLILGIRAMMENGADPESAPTLWIVIPILTVLAIALMRQDHGLHAHFGAHGTPADTFLLLTRFLAVQLSFGLFGWLVLSRQHYFSRFVTGDETSPGSYALVCPGVALAVMLQFFVNKGLVGVGLIDKFSPAYWTLTAIALALQAITIWLVLTLNARHTSRRPGPQPAPAE